MVESFTQSVQENLHIWIAVGKKHSVCKECWNIYMKAYTLLYQFSSHLTIKISIYPFILNIYTKFLLMLLEISNIIYL